MLKLLSKNKDDKWYKEIAQMYFTSMGNYNLRPDFEEKHKLFKFFNNDLTDYIEDINNLCNDVISVGAAEDMLLHYNVIRNKYDVLHGELLRRGNNHKIVLLTAKAIKAKNDDMLERIMANVEDDMRVLMERVASTFQTMPRQDLEKFLEEERGLITPRDINYKNFLSDTEIYKNKMLKYIYMTDDILKKKADTFQHQFIVSEFYLKNDWLYGKPTIKMLNPLYCQYHKSGNEYDAGKSDWFRYTDQITVGQALNEYSNVLGETELEEILRNGTVISPVNPDHLKTILHDYQNYYLARNMGRTTNSLWGMSETNNHDNYWFNWNVKRIHLEWKAWDEMLFYTHKDEYGASITVILDNKTSIIPEELKPVKFINEFFEEDEKYIWSDNAGEHEVEVKWIPQRYEMTRLGFNTDIQKRKVPLQPLDTHNPISNFSLSYKGGAMNNVNSKACSRMQNALPSALQIIAAKALQNKEMAKFRGSTIMRDVAQIPIELATDKENPIDILTKVEVLGRKTGTEYYDSEASRNGLPSNQRSVGVSAQTIGDANLFMYLQNFIQALNVEVGLNCGVPPSREGVSAGNAAVTNEQQNLVQTSLATEKDYFEHGRVWNTALNECLQAWDIYFKNYFEKNPDDNSTFLEYITPDGTKELIEVLPKDVRQEGYGVFLQDSYSDVEYKNFMKLQMQQNTQDIDIVTRSMILKSMASGASAEEIHRDIQMMVADIQKKAQQQQEAELQAQQQQLQAQKDLLAYQSELRVQEAALISDAQRQTKIELEQIAAQRFALEADINNNALNDSIEQAKLKIEADKQMQDKQIEADKELEKIKTQGKIQIEKAKPRPKSPSK